MSKPLDRYLDEYGRALKARAAAGERRRRGGLLRFAVAVSAAFLVFATLLLTGTFSSRTQDDAIAEARAALEPDGDDMVYLRIISTADAIGGVGVSRAGTRTTEQWIATDPPRWRVVQTVSANGREVSRHEYAFGRGAQSTYDSERGSLTIREGLAEDGLAARPPGPFGGDPERTLSALLRSATTSDLGVARAAGREVRRLRVVRPDRGRGRTVLTYDVDPQTFAPVAGEVRTTLPRLGEGVELIDRFVVEAYRRIPLDADAAELLEIDPPAGTKVSRLTAEQAAAQQRRWRRPGQP